MPLFSYMLGALFASNALAAPPLKPMFSDPNAYWGDVTVSDFGSSTLDDGSHNPNEIKGWGAASGSAWQPKPEPQEQPAQPQQPQMPQSGYGQSTGYMPSGFGQSSYQQSGFGYSQPSYGMSTGYGTQTGYSTGYSPSYGQTGYSSGYSQTGYDQYGYSSGFSQPQMPVSGGQMPGGQQPMGAPGMGQGMGMPAGGAMGAAPGMGMGAAPGMGMGAAPGMGQVPGAAAAEAAGKCPLPHRHRKPWALLTTEQKDMFVEGFQQIRKNGKLDVIAQTHAQHDVQNYVHYTSLYAFYNAYLVWEVEGAIRDLGGKFACFTMPYYDWTLDAGIENDPTLLKSGIGGDGDEDNNLCVKDDDTGFSWKTCSDTSPWTSTPSNDDYDELREGENDELPEQPQPEEEEEEEEDLDLTSLLSKHYIDYSGAYEEFDAGLALDDDEDEDQLLEAEGVEEQCFWTQANCMADENAPYCCLKRKKSNTVLLPSAAEIGDAMYRSKNIKEWQGYLNEYANQVSALYGADYYAHLSNGYSSEDPIFWLTQSFVVHLFSLWQDCWNYNNIPKDKLDMHYNSYHPYCGTFDATPESCVSYNLALDAPMNFFELQKADWAMAAHKIITVRKMWTPDFWNVVYELGPFYKTSGINNWCDNTRDSEWFIETMDYDVDAVKTDLNRFSDKVRTQMIKDGVEPSGVFKTVGALSCRYNRKYSENSCWDEEFEELKSDRATCNDEEAEDMDTETLLEQTLEDFFAYDGVDANQCFKRIRREVFPYSEHSIQVKKQLCKGDWDYKCPEYNELLYGQYAEFLDSPMDALKDVAHKSGFAKNGWIWMIIINGILILIVAAGCGIWCCSRAKTAKSTSHTGSEEHGNITVENDSAEDNVFGTITETSQEEYQPLLV